LIVNTNTTRLHQHVDATRLVERVQNTRFSFSGIDHDSCPIRIRNVSMFLSIVSVGFVKGDLMAEFM